MRKIYTNEALINDFLKGIMGEAGMLNLDPAVEEQMMDDLKARLQERIFAVVLQNLSEDQITQLRELDENKADAETIEKFIQSNLKNAPEVFSNVMLSFREDYLGV